ncbi:MAG: 2-amino-4-hydroxy-6-hydroxymethyldihydropteridine diphosphokinase [Pseudomonadota bacterium]
MTEVVIALGANLPLDNQPPMETLNSALKLLGNISSLSYTRRSRWYRSPAYPPGSGPDFVNGAACFETDLRAADVLELLHETEANLGRSREWRWAPRVCDLDLLFRGQQVLPDEQTCAEWMALDQGKAQTVVPPHLILPHPRMHERAFVLLPLAEICPNWCHPLTGKTVEEMASALAAADLQQLEPIEE